MSTPAAPVSQAQPIASRGNSGAFATPPPSRALGHGGNNGTTRFVMNAKARTQFLVDSMMARLQTYRTFQPVLVKNEVYGKEGLTYPPPQKHLYASGQADYDVGSSMAPSSNPWHVIDRALTSASGAVLRHNFNDNFDATVNRYTAAHAQGRVMGKGKRGTTTHVIEVVSDVTPSANAAASQGRFADDADAPNGATMPVVDTHKVFLDAWRRDHPTATAKEVRQQSDLWVQERLEAERYTRQLHLNKLKEELQHLMEEDGATAHDSYSLRTPENGAMRPDVDDDDGVPPHVLHARAMAALREEQQRLWEHYCAAERMAEEAAAKPVVADVAAGRIVYGYDEDNSVREWVQHRWRTHTHRHENAALMIQRAFRMYVAKSILARRRAARQWVFAESRRAECVARQQWELAVRISATQAGNSKESERSLRALQFFSNRVVALAEMRRARRERMEQEEQELQLYAATTIQRLYRGHLGRRQAMYVRYPELWEAVQLKKATAAAIVVQKTWRWYSTRAMIARRHRAAKVVQCAFRSYQARVRALVLRHRIRRAGLTELRVCAEAVVKRFCLACVLKLRAAKQAAAATEAAAT